MSLRPLSSVLIVVLVLILTPMVLLVVIAYLVGDKQLSSTVIAGSSVTIWVFFATTVRLLGRSNVTEPFAIAVCLLWLVGLSPVALFLAGRYFFISEVDTSAALPVATSISGSLIGVAVMLILWNQTKTASRGPRAHD